MLFGDFCTAVFFEWGKTHQKYAWENVVSKNVTHNNAFWEKTSLDRQGIKETKEICQAVYEKRNSVFLKCSCCLWHSLLFLRVLADWWRAASSHTVKCWQHPEQWSGQPLGGAKVAAWKMLCCSSPSCFQCQNSQLGQDIFQKWGHFSLVPAPV